MSIVNGCGCSISAFSASPPARCKLIVAIVGTRFQAVDDVEQQLPLAHAEQRVVLGAVFAHQRNDLIALTPSARGYLENQPANWFDFSSSLGASVMCDYMLERLGNDVTYAMNRGIPGITDNQRSGEWAACVEERGNWNLAYEHYGEYTNEGGFEGTQLILQAYPEATFIHNANTAMAMGSVQAQIAVEATGDVFSTGWGGTGLEVEAIRRGEIDATPMRMGDDVGAATAEAIKYHLEGRADELPFVFLGRITVAHDQMSDEELSALEEEAFRFSGVAPLER